MQVTISYGDDIFPLEISPDIELENLKVLVQLDTQIVPNNQVLFLNGKALLGDDKTVASLGVSDGDVILMTIKTAPVAHPPNTSVGNRNTATGVASRSIDWGAVQIPGSSGGQQPVSQPSSQTMSAPTRSLPNQEDPEQIRQMLINNPHQLSLLRERNPRLADAVLSNPEQFRKILDEQRVELMERQRQRIQMLTADPFDPDVQRRIAEEIRMENVNANMETAMEHSPESFAQVFMLYINCIVNGHPVKAFVDSGAQMTIMSKACAERCNITHLMDHRWSGTAVGVGTQRILGRVHVCQIQIETSFFPSSFVVLEDQRMDMLLGLDMLKRHQCCIDLRKNVLSIGTTNIETPFLPEADLPAFARQHSEAPDEQSATPSLQQEEDSLLAKALAESAQNPR